MANSVDPIEAALDELDAEEGQSSKSGLRRFLPAITAMLVLSGFGVIVWYAYSTGIREGSEIAAPLLKPSGPSKIAPQDPGGREILDQDKRVYGVIDRSDEGRRVERLLPPPENPLPLPKKPVPAAAPPLPTPKLAVPQTPPPPPSITAPATVASASQSVTQAAAESPKPAVKLEKPPVPKVVNKPVVSEKKRSVPPPPKPVAVKQKPEPKPRPQVVASAAPVAPKPPFVSANAPPAKSGAEGYRVQIASLRSEDAARREWDKRVKQSGAILSSLTLFVKKVDIAKKGTFYRVQAGPLADRDAARRVCGALKQRKIGCLVVKP